MYSFRSLREKDFPVLLEWLSRPHVKEWWDDGDDTLEKVAAHYSADPDETRRFLLFRQTHEVQTAVVPVGYFQYYMQPRGVVGIDQFLAERTLLNQGIGTLVIRQFIELIKARENPRCIIVDPELRNRRAIRCYEKMGFRYVGIIKRAEGTLCMMRLDL